jgi:putative ABC transport system substrate-binding protein
MQRREFITLIGGAAVASPLVARAQRPDQMRRVGVLMAYRETDPEAQALLAEFTKGLSELGWTGGHNLRLEWAPGDIDTIRTSQRSWSPLNPT